MIMFPHRGQRVPLMREQRSAHGHRHPAGRLRCVRRRNIPGRKVRLYRCAFGPLGLQSMAVDRAQIDVITRQSPDSDAGL